MTSEPLTTNTASPRQVWVAQVLIKACLPGAAGPLYLVRRDGQLTGEYRLIGGRQERFDDGLLETAKREVGEELGLRYGRDYVLEELIDELVVPTRLSPTYGVPTSYHYRVYRAELIRDVQLMFGDNTWVSKHELLVGQTSGGEKIAAWHARAIDSQVPGGLDGLVPSFSSEQDCGLLASSGTIGANHGERRTTIDDGRQPGPQPKRDDVEG